MGPDQVSNQGPFALESDALPSEILILQLYKFSFYINILELCSKHIFTVTFYTDDGHDDAVL